MPALSHRLHFEALSLKASCCPLLISPVTLWQPCLYDFPIDNTELAYSKGQRPRRARSQPCITKPGNAARITLPWGVQLLHGTPIATNRLSPTPKRGGTCNLSRMVRPRVLGNRRLCSERRANERVTASMFQEGSPNHSISRASGSNHFVNQ